MSSIVFCRTEQYPIRAMIFTIRPSVFWLERRVALTGEVGYRYKAAKLIARLDTTRHPAGGWREGTVKPFPRRQNPHMHLLEASRAPYQATG